MGAGSKDSQEMTQQPTPDCKHGWNCLLVRNFPPKQSLKMQRNRKDASVMPQVWSVGRAGPLVLEVVWEGRLRSLPSLPARLLVFPTFLCTVFCPGSLCLEGSALHIVIWESSGLCYLWPSAISPAGSGTALI